MAVVGQAGALKAWSNIGETLLGNDLNGNFTELHDKFNAHSHNEYAASSHTHPWSQITGTPTTIGDYGITDAYTKTQADAAYAPRATTLAGYNIGDAYTKAQADAKYLPLAGGDLTGTLGNTTGFATHGMARSALSAWSTLRPIEGPHGTSLSFHSAQPSLFLTSNAYYDGTTWRRKEAAAASLYDLSDDHHALNVAVSGTAGSAVTWKSALVLASDGKATFGDQVTLAAAGLKFSDATALTTKPTAANLTGNLPVARLNGGSGATASSFWRGDGTWAIPNVSGKPLGYDVDTNNTGNQQLSNSPLAVGPSVSFTVPSSGSVLVKLFAYAIAGTQDEVSFGVSGSATVNFGQVVGTSGEGGASAAAVVSGLTPGSVATLNFTATGGFNSGEIGKGIAYPDPVMEVWEV